MCVCRGNDTLKLKNRHTQTLGADTLTLEVTTAADLPALESPHSWLALALSTVHGVPATQ